MAITTNKRFLIAIILFLVLIAEGCVHILREDKKVLTLDKAIITSGKKVEELGYNLDDLEVIANEQNLIWCQHRKNVSVDFGRLDKKLESRKYWAIYYRPKKSQFGGDLFIFIDKNTGEIIDYLRGQ